MLPPRHRNQGFELGFAPCPLTNDGAPHALNVLRAVLEGLRALKHEHRMLVRRVLLPLHACLHTARLPLSCSSLIARFRPPL